MNQAFEPGVGHFDWGWTIVPPQGRDRHKGADICPYPGEGQLATKKHEPYVPHCFFSSESGAGHLPTLFVLV